MNLTFRQSKLPKKNSGLEVLINQDLFKYFVSVSFYTTQFDNLGYN